MFLSLLGKPKKMDEFEIDRASHFFHRDGKIIILKLWLKKPFAVVSGI